MSESKAAIISSSSGSKLEKDESVSDSEESRFGVDKSVLSSGISGESSMGIKGGSSIAPASIISSVVSKSDTTESE